MGDQTLAPEEPNVYRSNEYSKTCAPAERDISPMVQDAG